MTLMTLLWILALGVALWAVEKYMKREEPRYKALREVLVLFIKVGLVLCALIVFRAADLHAQDTIVLRCPVGASSCTQTLVKPPVVVPPPVVVAPPPSGASNEPSGMIRLTESGFNCVNGCGEWGWWDGPVSNTAIVPETTSRGYSNTVQQLFKTTLTGGTSPGSFGTTFAQKQTIYVAIWMKVSSNFQGHPSGVNKVLHLFTAAGRNIAVFNLRGAGTTGSLAPEVLLQGIGIPMFYAPNGYTATEQNLTGSCVLKRATWAKIELVLTGNTPGTANGRAELWMDGVKCLDVASIGYVASGQVSAWKDIWWSPTWGGTGGSPSAQFYEAVDHIYVSGK